jgi:hypothetical protein
MRILNDAELSTSSPTDVPAPTPKLPWTKPVLSRLEMIQTQGGGNGGPDVTMYKASVS